MSDNYFKSWISDEEPKVPEGWGLDTCRGVRLAGSFCEKCHGAIAFRQQYIYRFTEDGVRVRHNTEHCTKGVTS